MADNSLERQILALLTPYFGPKMAEGTLTLSCSAAGIELGALGPADMLVLAKDIERRLGIFLGSDKAGLVARQIAALKP